MICDIRRQGYTIQMVFAEFSFLGEKTPTTRTNKEKILKTKWDLQTFLQSLVIVFPLLHIFSCRYGVMRNMINCNRSFIATSSFLLFSNLECTLKLTASVFSFWAILHLTNLNWKVQEDQSSLLFFVCSGLSPC